MRTSPAQFEMMVHFMEQHGDISKPSKDPRGKLKSLENWETLTDLLNSESSSERRPADRWKKVWTDLRNNCKKKAAKIHRAAQGTGGGPACIARLSDLEKRVLKIIGPQVPTGSLAVNEAGFPQLLGVVGGAAAAGELARVSSLRHVMSVTVIIPRREVHDVARGSEMSDSYMWKEQIHTLMKGGESESDISDSESFLTKGAFLLTPSHGLSMEKAAAICEKMEFKGCFSLTKTATGILFKFSHVDDYQMVFKKGFHKVTGSRFYRKIAIPCRPQKTFTIYVYDIPDEVPEEDVRHALYKFTSVVEVLRLHFSGSPREGTSTPKPHEKASRALTTIDGELVSSMVPKEASSVLRVTLANIEEANILLQNGLDFYGATYFPTELATPAQAAKLIKPSRMTGGTVSARVRDLLPVFDQAGFAKYAPPASRLVKPRSK